MKDIKLNGIKMLMFNLFKFFQKKKKYKPNIDLTAWNHFLNCDDGWIGTILSEVHMNDIGKALAFVDEKIKNRFINVAYNQNRSFELSSAIMKNKNISKYESSKAKLILVSVLKSNKAHHVSRYPD
jgi:hypothetical protein